MGKTKQEAITAQVQSDSSTFQKGSSAPSRKLLVFGWLYVVSCLPFDIDDDPVANEKSRGEGKSEKSEKK